MRIEMNTFNPTSSKVELTHAELITIAMDVEPNDSFIVLGYDADDYDRPYAEYTSGGKVRKKLTWYTKKDRR